MKQTLNYPQQEAQRNVTESKIKRLVETENKLGRKPNFMVLQ